MSDIVVNVTNAGAANVAVSNGSTVNAVVGSGGSVNVALGSISPGNATVVSGTLTINSTTTLAAGAPAYVVNNGTAYAAKLDIGIPSGPATNVTVGKVSTLSAGSNATVTGTANGSTLTLDFGIPAGASGSNGTNGTTPSFSIGKVSTLAAGSSANVTLTTANSGANVTLDFGIPAGADGNGSVSLSNATPSNLGTASAGSSNLAARADHVHSLPVISYANLSGVPTNFPTNATLVSGLSSATVSSVNNLTGALTLAAGANVTLTSNGSTLTLSSSGGLGADDAVDGGNYVGYIPANTITIATQPSPQTASGGAATFTVAASSSPGGTVSYQWQKQDGGFGVFTDVSGATSTTLALSGLLNTVDDGDLYRVVVSATNAVSVNSASVRLTVPANVITVTTQPTNQTASGGSATFAAAATVAPSGTPSYQWQRSADAGVTWASVSGATSSSLALSGLTGANNGEQYRVVVSASNAASVTSNAATLTTPQASITSQPKYQRIVGGAATFSVTASPGTSGVLSYQWQKLESGGSSWSNVANETSTSLSLSGLTLADDGGDQYRVSVSSGDGVVVQSEPAVLMRNTDWNAAALTGTARYFSPYLIISRTYNPGSPPTAVDVFVTPDGMSVFAAMSDNYIEKFSLSTPWQLSNVTYAQSLSVQSRQTGLRSVFFAGDGLRMYITGTSSGIVNAYTLSSAWDLSAAAHTSQFSLSAIGSPIAVRISPDGRHMHTLNSNATVAQYSLSAPWDVSTSTFVRSASFSATDSQPSGLVFRPDGMAMFYVGNYSDYMYEFDLSAAWNVSTATYLRRTGYLGSPIGPCFGNNGTRAYIADWIGLTISEMTSS